MESSLRNSLRETYPPFLYHNILVETSMSWGQHNIEMPPPPPQKGLGQTPVNHFSVEGILSCEMCWSVAVDPPPPGCSAQPCLRPVITASTGTESVGDLFAVGCTEVASRRSVQLAFYRLEKRFVPTYEPAMMRLWRNGRTETIRSCSKTSCAWVRAMEDPTGVLKQRGCVLALCLLSVAACL